MWEQGLQLSAAMEMSGRFVMSGFFALLLLATAGCSFKKNPDANRPQVIIVEEKVSPVVGLTIEEIIAGEDEERAIELLKERKTEVDMMANDEQQSPLDLAIKHEKHSVISHLLVYGHSPFAINQHSRDILAKDDAIDRLLNNARAAARVDILRGYHAVDEFTLDSFYVEAIRNKVDQYKLRKAGCEDVLDYLMEYEFVGTQGRHHQVEVPDARLVFRTMLEKTECRSYKSSLSRELVSKWMRYEFYEQFLVSFQSYDFFKYLRDIRGGGDVKISMAFERSNDSSGAFRALPKEVGPIPFLLLKRNCLEHQKFTRWINIIKGREEDDSSIDEEQVFSPSECSDEGCEAGVVSTEDLFEIYNYFYPKRDVELWQFEIAYLGAYHRLMGQPRSVWEKFDFVKGLDHLCLDIPKEKRR